MTTRNKPYGLYIHIPFCISKCRYCDFYSLPYSETLAKDYVTALCSELKAIGAKYNKPNIDTVYIGGGTPSVLPLSELESITETVYNSFSFDNKEFTTEMNPADDIDFVGLKNLGINRVSIGVQSLDKAVLSLLGRRHSPETAIKTLNAAVEVFDNVSADLMLGLPTQTPQSVIKDIDIIAPIVKHVSAYLLKLSPQVPMSLDVKSGKTVLPDDDLTVDIYDAARAELKKFGLNRYEISNFAKVGYESRHNLKYWERVGYFAAGAAAHSFVDGTRYFNPSDINAYINGDNFGCDKGGKTDLTRDDALFETVMLALRLPKGIDINAVNAEYNIDFIYKYKEALKNLKDILVVENDRAYLKDDAFLLESYAAREFI